jgi:DNA polymerase-4
VRVRFSGLRSVTRSITLAAPISTTLTLTEVATQLGGAALADHPDEREISLLAISVSKLVHEPALQLELPLGPARDGWRSGSVTGAARWTLDRSVDAIRARFGRAAVGYASVMLTTDRHVPDEFRELAQHDDSG